MIRAFAVVFVMLGWVSSAHADDAAKFERIKGRAQPLGGLSAFLENYVGDCNDPNGMAQCRSNAERFRRENAGKTFFMIVSEDQAIVSPGAIDEDQGEFTVNITPFFPASNYALTAGKPSKTDGSGNPVMSFLRVRGKIPDGENATTLQRMFRTRPFKLEVVFTPQAVWALPKKGGGKIQGVQAKVHAILVSNARGGGDVGLWTN